VNGARGPLGAVDPVRVPLTSSMSLAEAALCLRGDRHPFALAGDWLGGLCVLGSDPVCMAGAADDPFSVLDRLPVVGATQLPGADSAGALVGGGWVGWLGYGLGRLIERLPPPPPAPVPRAPFSLAYYDHVILFDGERWWFEALWSTERERELRARLALWRSRLSGTGGGAARRVTLDPFRLAANGADGHLDAVAQCRHRIARGDLFQANLCVRLESRLRGDPLDLFCTALVSAQPRFGAFVDGAVSLSPERFLRRTGRSVSTEPIKGTRPRPPTDAAERAARAELIASAKDAAEHVMIVDLMRNDLGRVCAYGSISAAAARAEPHAGVWHLVSTVSGTLRDGVGNGELLRATFPPGSVTGAPKVQAMKVISELEATRREVYTGAIGIVGPLAGLDLSVAIRTFEICGDAIWFGAGGGIVADSVPELELSEAFTKARGPLAAVGGRVEDPGAAARPSAGRAHLPRALALGHRPDPRRGVFETVLAEDGQPVMLAAHLARLMASAQALYGLALDRSELADGAHEACADSRGGRARLRVQVDPDGAVSFETAPAGAAPASAAAGGTVEEPLRLTPFLLPGGLGAHKWRDRRLLEALASTAPGTVPLLVDTDGSVLEASFANVWIVERDELLTPPADGRLLPGVARSALLESDPLASELAFDLGRLGRAAAVFLTSSISGRSTARLALAADRSLAG
jgi:para-aminobenzoate synthetase/4-amino-4-deoxychorismate lyase